GPPLVVPADPPRRPLTHHLAGLCGFTDEEPVAVLGVVEVCVQQCVCSVGLGQLGCGDLLVPPVIVGLTGELQDPQGHRDGNVVSGELAHERVPPFPGRFAWDRYAAARRRTSFSCSNSRTRRLASRSSWDSADVVPGLIPASTSALRIHFCNVMGWIPKSAAICSRVTPSSRF